MYIIWRPNAGCSKCLSLKKTCLGPLTRPRFWTHPMFEIWWSCIYSSIRKDINRNCMQKEKRSREKLKTTNDNKRKEEKKSKKEKRKEQGQEKKLKTKKRKDRNQTAWNNKWKENKIKKQSRKEERSKNTATTNVAKTESINNIYAIYSLKGGFSTALIYVLDFQLAKVVLICFPMTFSGILWPSLFFWAWCV